MALIDIFKMKKLGGTVLLKDNSFLYISKVTGTQFEEKGKDMRILYEDGNGVKNEFMISQVKEARATEPIAPVSCNALDTDNEPLARQIAVNNDHLLTENFKTEIYKIMNDDKTENIGINKKNNLHYVPPETLDKNLDEDPYKIARQIAVNNDHLLTESFKTEIYKIMNEPSDKKINLDYVPPETLDKNYDYQAQGLYYEEFVLRSPQFTKDLGSFKKRKITEVPLMDDDLEKVFNRTREESYKLIESMIDKGVEKFEFSSQTIPTDIYEILIMSKGKKKWFAVLQNDNEDVFILDMNSLFIVNAIFDKSKSVPSVEEEPSVEKSSVKIETKSQDYPGGPWFLNKRRKLDVSSLQDIIRGDDCKYIIVPGEPALYNAYLKRDLKETMIENLIKKELSNDLNILLDEVKKDPFKDFLIYVGDDIKPHTMIRVDKEGCEETYGLTRDDWSLANVKCSPLPAHLKCLAPTRYVEEGHSTEEKYFTPIKEIKVPDAPRKKVSKDDTFKDPSNLNINDMVTFLYKGDEKRVLVKESNDKYLEGICQEKNKYKKYLVRYIERPRVSLEKVVSYRETLGLSREPPVYSSDEDTKDLGSDTDTDIDIDASDEGPINMPYKRMVLNAIKDMYVNGTRGSSRQAIQAYLLANYNHHINESRFQDNLRRTLKRLVETGCIVKNKQKFKLGDEGRKYLKKFTLKELKPVKVNSTQKTKDDKLTHSKQGLSKHDLIQYAIDNEKILDIMYDGGSIPDIKRPIRPLKVFKTAYSKKEILQAICIIDDNIKKFTLDKVTVISFIEE